MLLTPEIWAVLIFLVTYGLIVDERIHRAVCAMAGASVLIIFGILDWDQVLSSIDFGTIFLLMGMMVIVNTSSRSGLFEFVALKTAKAAKGDPIRVILLFSLVTAVASAFLDNVTTVLLLTPMILTITRLMDLNPVPYLMAEIFSSNIGGAATLIGDPPNIMIGSAAGLSFNEFIQYMGPVAVVNMFVMALFILVMYRAEFRSSDERKMAMIRALDTMDEYAAVSDPVLFKKSVLTIFGVVLLFFFHSTFGLEPAEVALIGASFLLIWTREPVESIFEKIEWPALFFFGGLFVLVGGLVETGVISDIANIVITIVSDTGTAMIVVCWFSAFASGIVDNIPLTAAMIPLIKDISMAPGIDEYPLWWALSLGACLGGNLTAIGASANVVVLGLLDREGTSISFMQFLKMGFWITIITVSVGLVVLFLLFPQYIPIY